MAVFPVPGWPPIRMALPAIFPSFIMLKMIPADFLALNYDHMSIQKFYEEEKRRKKD